MTAPSPRERRRVRSRYLHTQLGLTAKSSVERIAKAWSRLLDRLANYEIAQAELASEVVKLKMCDRDVADLRSRLEQVVSDLNLERAPEDSL